MPQAHPSTQPLSPAAALVRDVIDRVEELLVAAEKAGQAIEVDPHRARLFELFVMADASGFLAEGANHDLSCDGIARELASRWEMARGVNPGALNPTSLPPAKLARLRLLWSFMRMWMEWTYAWQRWNEFHAPETPRPPKK